MQKVSIFFCSQEMSSQSSGDLMNTVNGTVSTVISSCHKVDKCWDGQVNNSVLAVFIKSLLIIMGAWTSRTHTDTKI